MKRRSGNVELWKFIMSLLIILSHSYAFTADTFVADAWLYVMFFYMITGFFTARHFDTQPQDRPFRLSVEYTLNKFLPLIPYVFVATLVAWALRNFPMPVVNAAHFRQLFDTFGDAALDTFFLGDAFGYSLIPPMWYLSAMFMVFPLFCRMVQIREKSLLLYGSAMLIVCYYGTIGFEFERSFRFIPFDQIRAFSGLSMGLLLYEIMAHFPVKKLSAGLRLVLTAVEVLGLVYTVFAVWMDAGTYRLMIICFLVSGGLMLSGVTYTSVIGGKFISWLGRMSVPMYIMHWMVILLLNNFDSDNVTKSLLLKCYAGTFAVSAVMLYLMEHISFLKKLQTSPVKLTR